MSVTDEREQELNRRFLDYMAEPENLNEATSEIYDDLLDEVIIGFVFDIHRNLKIGTSEVEEGVPDEESYAVVDSPGLDVFGQHPIKKSQDCNCPNCDRNVAASRFATHLEKCMGMGRNSSRIASRRIANNSKDLSTFTGIISDDDDDADWSMGNDKRKRKKDKNGFKKSKISKTGKTTPTLTNQRKNGGSNGSGAGSDELVLTSSENSPSNFEALSLDEKRALLQHICGVISDHTKKLCTRSTKCPQHTDEQRKEMRSNLEAQGSGTSQSQEEASTSNIDVDNFDETDSQNLRETLSRWDQEGSNHSSPADSASTTSTSSNSRKRDSKSKSKGIRSKRERLSPSTPPE